MILFLVITMFMMKINASLCLNLVTTRYIKTNVSNCETGIDVFHDAAENAIYNNTLANSRIGLGIRESGSGNQIYSNTIIDAAEKPPPF
jgi:parallel beta-helix repeat protein